MVFLYRTRNSSTAYMVPFLVNRAQKMDEKRLMEEFKNLRKQRAPGWLLWLSI